MISELTVMTYDLGASPSVYDLFFKNKQINKQRDTVVAHKYFTSQKGRLYVFFQLERQVKFSNSAHTKKQIIHSCIFSSSADIFSPFAFLKFKQLLIFTGEKTFQNFDYLIFPILSFQVQNTLGLFQIGNIFFFYHCYPAKSKDYQNRFFVFLFVCCFTASEKSCQNFQDTAFSSFTILTFRYTNM